jgi:hypothetical protein
MFGQVTRMQTINFDDYIGGGYFLVKLVPRPPELGEPLPQTILTLSNCFTEIAPDDWTVGGYKYEDSERASEAKKFGIPAEVVPELVKLMTQETGTLLPRAFPNLSVGMEFYRCCAAKLEFALVGIGLHRSLTTSFHQQLDKDINGGYGLVERVDLDQPLAKGGRPLGYEPLGFEGTHFHSWLCHSMPKEASERLGLLPNRDGFIDTLDDAVRITEHMVATGAEPAIWEPWLVARYGA